MLARITILSGVLVVGVIAGVGACTEVGVCVVVVVASGVCTCIGVDVVCVLLSTYRHTVI